MRRALLLCATLALAACGGGSLNLPGLQAEKIGSVPGPGACGVRDAYRVTSAAGVRLSQSATLSRRAAERFDLWMREHAVPIIGNKGGGLASVQVAAHYVCRTRNHRPGARLSEHSFGNAIDISAFILKDGTRLTVLNDWNGSNRRIMRRLHASACGPFGTVLGPNSDRLHRDHFHFDVAQHRGGAYCR